MEYKEILKGMAASHGIKEGKVRIIESYEKSFDLNFKEGEILVAKKTYPELVIYMEKASAIITDTGGTLSHAAIVSRELGIPCIVGTIKATDVLKNGMIVKVDGTSGIVYTSLDKISNKDKIIEEQAKLQKHKAPKSPGLSYVYKEIREELNGFLENYNDINFKVCDKHDPILNKLSSFMYEKIIEKVIPLMKEKCNEKEFNEWFSTLQKALDFYKNADSPSKKIIAITWMDKIIRATSLK